MGKNGKSTGNGSGSFWSDLFDFDGDGNVSPDEEFLGYLMFEELMEEKEEHPRDRGRGKRMKY